MRQECQSARSCTPPRLVQVEQRPEFRPQMPDQRVVRHRAGWREHAVVSASTVTVIDTEAAPVGAWLGVLGQTGFTAWVGLKRIGELRPGDTVFVSAAAGAVDTAALVAVFF